MNESQWQGATVNDSDAPVQVRDLRTLLWVLEYHAPFAVALNKCVTPVWYLLGIVGNLLSGVIWIHPRMRTGNSSAFYLVSLAGADFLYLFLQLFYELKNPWQLRTLDEAGWCETWNLLYMATQYVCVLLVLAFTVERFLSICHPFKSERFARTTRTPKVSAAMIAISVLLAAPQAYFWHAAGDGECRLREVESAGLDRSFYSYWSWGSEMIMFGAVPVVVLLLNVCVLRKIRTVGRLQFNDAVRRSSNYGTLRYKSTTVTLLCVSFYLIFTLLPVTIVFALQSSIYMGPPLSLREMGSDPVWRRYFTYYSTTVIIKEVGMSHHACNIFIYCATSRRFRQFLLHLLCYQGRCSKESDIMSTRASHNNNHHTQIEML